jgi:hypothetical protein
MNKEKLSAVLTVLIPPILEFIMKDRNIDNKAASKLLYGSDLYEMLEREESKLWHLSAESLYTLLKQELAAGKIDYPEEA